MPTARTASRETLQNGRLGLELLERRQTLGQLVIRKVYVLEFIAVVVLLEGDAVRASLNRIEAIALDHEDESRGAGFAFPIG